MGAKGDAKLHPKMEAFCQEYLVDLNGAGAARRAGYSPKNPGRQAIALLARQDVQERLTELRGELMERTGITQERVLKELALCGFLNIQEVLSHCNDVLDVGDWPEEVARAISGFDVVQRFDQDGNETRTTKLKFVDKKGSLQLIGNHIGMFQTNVKVTGKVDHEHTGTIEHKTESTDEFLAKALGETKSTPEVKH